MAQLEIKITSAPSTALFQSEPLGVQIKSLLSGFGYDGTTLTYLNKKIKSGEELDALYEKYKNPIANFIVTDEDVEDLLPFVQAFNEKRFWQIDYNDKIKLKDGEQLVFQDGQSIVVKAGEYLNGGILKEEEDTKKKTAMDMDMPVNLSKSFVYVYRTKKIERPKNNFYVMVEGDYAIKIFHKPVIRFYFNLKAEKQGVLDWSKFIQDSLNHYRIPFQLKYPLNLENYNYSDSGVLYVSQNHFPLVAPLINHIAQKFNYLLFESVPLFTLKLYNGIGFSEDPRILYDGIGSSEDPQVIKKRESFGEHRCDLIWNIIKTKNITFDDQNLGDKVSEIVKELKWHSNDFYRNPNTNYEYNFKKHIKKTGVQIEIKVSPSIFSLLQSYITVTKIAKIEYDKLMEKLDRKRFLEIAENYGKDLIEKAIWNPGKDNYRWLTYDKTDLGEEIYRVSSPKEDGQIRVFLLKLYEETKDSYYEKFANKVSVSSGGTPLKFNWKELTEGLDKKSGKKMIEILDSIQETFDRIPVTLLSPEEDVKELAKKIEQYFEKFSLPMENTFGNYEYCPNYNGKLKIAVLFLLASSPRTSKELLEFYKAWYNTNTDAAKTIIATWKSKFQSLTR